MVVGFNHNFRYKGALYHVQTEDGGLKNPQVTTLLYRGGIILSSKKTSYADLLKTEHLEKIVEETMKEQHREMLRQLRDGHFDLLIERLGRSAPAASGASATPGGTASPKPLMPTPQSSPAPGAAPSHAGDKALEADLDELIFAYLLGEGDK